MALTIRELRAACAPLESALQDLGAASAEALAALRPGRAAAGEGDRAWLHYYGELRTRHAVVSGSQPAGSGGRATASGLTPELALEQNLGAEPRPVQLSDGTTVHVHPKGLHALRWLDSLDRQLVDTVALASSLSTPTDIGAPMALVPVVEAYATRLWAWVLTSEGSEVPFDEAAAQLVPPEWTGRMTPEDVLSIWLAHLEVHGQRLRLTAEMYPSDPTRAPSRLSLAGFIGLQAQEMGVRPADLMRRWSLGELFGQSVASGIAHHSARAGRGAGSEE